MERITRRDFVKASMAAGVALALPGCVVKALSSSHVRGANDDIRVAVIGVRGHGRHLTGRFRDIPGVRVVALCDADRKVLAESAAQFTEGKGNIDTYVDLRDVLDRKDIDAIVTATPNHWHSLVTIWACQAGKDVYVEKPASHNIWEGRKMLEAARKYKRIVQVGTDSRSDEGLRQAIRYIQKGNLGRILVARGFSYKRRESIAKVDGPQPIPEWIDYNLWSGPAPMVPLMRKQLHYDWHWVWLTGNGDLGNMGIHFMDICRWALGQNRLAPRVMSIGGRFRWSDDGQSPNTHIAILDYEPAPIILEIRNLPRKKDDPAMDNYRGLRENVAIQCEHGYFAGGWAYDNDGRKIKQFPRDGGGGHAANFIKAVRSRKVSDLNADILEGHLSSALCHMANISHRIGVESAPEKIREVIQGDKRSLEAFERFQSHLLANGVDIKKTPVVLGPWLKMDSEKERFVGELSPRANELLKRDYRRPFVVPEQV